ncbi:MAG: 3-keto-disaccharide hydrolase [Flavobacteriaceae bacterium]
MMHFLYKRFYYLNILLLMISILFMKSCQPSAEDPDKEEWIFLFNGTNEDQWTPKFAGFELGFNHNNRFAFKDSLLSVRYTAQDTFKGNFGHLFYYQKFSHYKIMATYRFIGDQMAGGPEWALRNNGLMLHCQDPASMGFNQDFPISMELQLLGGDGVSNRTNANLCTPGTNVVMGDTLFTPHCVNSSSETYHGDNWVEVEALVLGDSLIQHILNSKVVLEYRKPTIGGGDIAGYQESAYREGAPLKEGYIAIQAETHPIDFKSIKLLNLCGCMDKKAKNYKSYFVKADNSTCRY